MGMTEQQAKAAFFAQYLGQRVWCFEQTITEVTAITIHYCEPSNYLLLRSIDQLTDEEKVNIALLTGWIKDKGVNLLEMGQSMVNLFLEDYHLSVMAYDYLRRIGVLIDFTYINQENEVITLQPADILARNWVKIKKD